MTYKVWVCLEAEYDDIEAESEEEAFLIASDAAMSGGSWDYTVTPIEEDEEEASRIAKAMQLRMAVHGCKP